MSFDSSLNASDLSLEMTSEPTNESVDLSGSSAENSEEIRESANSLSQRCLLYTFDYSVFSHLKDV